MYVLVQGAGPKYNSTQCLLFYISCLIVTMTMTMK